MTALPAVHAPALITSWRLDPAALVLAALVTGWYLARRRRLVRAGQPWSRRRTGALVAGVAGYVWCTNGFPNAYGPLLFWVWTIQVLALLLVVPLALMASQPGELAVRSTGAGRRSLLAAVLSSRPARFLAHPYVGPAVVPVLGGVLFFGHCADLWNTSQPVATALGAALVAIGGLIALPLTIDDPTVGSLAAGAALGIGVFEMLTDAIPGIALRLGRRLVTDHYAVPHAVWAMTPLADQKLAGAILWGVAELLDLPFLVILLHRWIRADEFDAARHDAAREARHRSGRPHGAAAAGDDAPGPAAEQPLLDEPWWLSDPRFGTRPSGAARPAEGGRPER